MPRVVQIPATWVGVEDIPIPFVNNVLVQVDDVGDLIIAFGQTTPPALTATTPEENAIALERIAFIPVRPVARISMSRTRLDQTITTLQNLAKLQDAHLAEMRRLAEEQNP